MRRSEAVDGAKRASYGVLGIFLFIVSIKTLRISVGSLYPVLKNLFVSLDLSAINSLGFGWIASYLILSGSPIAALSLNLFDAGLINALASFMMIMGSRLGAAFILVAIGLVEYVRGKSDLIDSLSVALLTFIVTYLVFLPGLILSYFIFQSSLLTAFQLQVPPLLINSINNLFLPLSQVILNFLGPALTFFSSLGLLYFSLSVFNKSFQGLELKEAKSSWINYLMRKPVFSFTLGALITLAAQSVSLSLGIIVPLYLQGYIQRRDIIPYIMGANLTTFFDTLMAAILIGNALAINIVLTVILGNLLITVVYLLTYRQFYKLTVRSVNLMLRDGRKLALFFALLLLVPLLLLLL